MLRTKSNPRYYLNLAKTAVFATNKEIPVYRVLTMEEVVREAHELARRWVGCLGNNGDFRGVGHGR